MVLQKMRAGAQGIGAKILVGLIVFTLAVFGFGAFDLFAVSEPIAATVDGTDITQRTLDMETERQRSAYPDVSEEVLDQLVNRESVLQALIERTLLNHAAEDLALVVSDEHVSKSARQMLADQAGLDPADLDAIMYRNMLASAGYTPTSFHAEFAADEVRGQLRGGFRDTAFVTQSELNQAARLQFQRRDIAWLLFDVTTLAADVEVSDDEVEAYYGDNLDDYMTEESHDFDLVRLPRSTLEEDIEVDDEAVQLAYENEIDGIGPRRHAAHILLQVGEDRTVEQAVETLAAVRAEVEAGADFAERARELSEDEGSASHGGNLGPAGRGVYVPAFEDALWALEPGQLSQPVETQYGVHLIQLVDILEPDIPTLEERRDAIVADLRRADAQARFDQTLGDMDKIAFEQGDSLDGLVDAYGLAVETLDGVTLSTRDGILADAGAREALFAEDVLLQGFNSRPVATGDDDGIVVARLRASHPAVERPLDEVQYAIRYRLSTNAAKEIAEQAAADALASLDAGETPADVADSAGVEWQRADGADRVNPDVPPEILALAFEMPAPAEGERDIDIATLADGSRAVVSLSDVTLGDYAALTETERSQLRQSLAQLGARRDETALLATLRAQASIDAIRFEADPAPAL